MFLQKCWLTIRTSASTQNGKRSTRFQSTRQNWSVAGGQKAVMTQTTTHDERSDHPFTKRSGDMVYTSVLDLSSTEVSMPWKERSIVEERMRFVLRLRDGESMASLCREFGISRVTGYKIFDRYKECGLEGLTDRARTPYRYANKLPAQLEAMIVTMRREKPTWGARKLRDRLLRKLPNDVRVPACSTIHAILDRHGLVARQRRSRTKTEGTPLSQGLAPNALWCTDYKGEFMLGDKRYCYPLTVSDHASRYLLLCEAMESVKEQGAFTAFERLFQERGLPHAIRSDNGIPFASPNGLFNLSRLAVWWLRLGITIERIQPGHPQQNGRHERMHR